MNRALIRCAMLVLGALPTVIPAQETTIRDGKQLAFTVTRDQPGDDLGMLMSRYLYPPELIMQHQSRLKITEQQRSVITGEIAKVQAAAVQMQWRVSEEAQKLLEQLQQPTIVEAEALQQIERMTTWETAVKRAQLAMLIRIRNALTPEQREMLKAIRAGDTARE